ncbi:hypothetical protein EDC04DRAFT_2893386 [Pisolithus marmoratus]|nr:hypothetical protein EDC04DRAFT_2893386 [Pisolithus marmoratus]
MVISKLDDMLQEGSTDESHIVHQIHLTLLAVWTTPWSKDKHYIVPDPTESCLALLTLNQDGSFKHPKEVTKLIAKFEYCMRLTFLKEIRACASADTNVDEAAACDDLQPWFNEKNYSTFARLHSLQHRASAIAFSTMALPSVWWTDTEAWSSLSFKGNHIAFSDVLKGLKLRVDYEHIVDDPSNRNVGYAFLFDSRNACFQDRACLVRSVVEGHGPFAGFLLHRDDKLIWNKAALCAWLQDYADLQKLLLMHAEMLSGAPSRGTELTAMLYRNTQARDTRNLMVFGKHVTLLGQYSKMSALTGQDKLIPHALDALTSDILIQDLALAHPFAEIAAKICFADEEVSQLYHDHLFVNFDRLFTSNDLSTVMAKYSLPQVKFAMTINPWRHIQTAWKRKFKCAMDDIVEMDMEDDVDALQAGHSCATENRVYGLSTHSLAGAAEDILPLFLQASMGWQEHCQVMPSGSGLPYQQARSYLFKPKASTRPPKEPTATMHNSSMSCATDDAMVDKIATWVVKHLAPMLTDLIHHLSKADSRSGGHPSHPDAAHEAPPAGGKGKGKQKATPGAAPLSDEPGSKEISSSMPSTPGDDAAEDSTTHRRVMLSAPPPPPSPSALALQKMQTLLQKENVSWLSSQQRDAMTEILAQESDMVVILPTGGGKSMLAIVPSLLEVNMVTILILPLNSLIMDYQRCLTKMGVPYQVYAPNRQLNLQDNLVIMSADKSQMPCWRSALADLARHKGIARIIVDEAHIPLISKGYCKSLEHFYNVRSESVPLVLLSATLPPPFIPPLTQMYRLLSNHTICRQQTNQPELTYILEKMSSESDLRTHGIQIVQEQARSWQSQDHGLVFVPAVGMCMELARDTGWHHFVGNREAMTTTEQQAQYQAWIEGQGSNIMVATSAFSTGNDYPHVCLMLHLDKPFDMLDYVQGQGRAGWNGMPAICHTLVPTKLWKESRKQDNTERHNEQAILDHLYLYGSKCCLQYGITLFMDGVGVGCHEQALNKLCSVCQVSPDHHPQDIHIAAMPCSRVDADSSSSNLKAALPHAPTSFTEAAQQVKELRAQQEVGALGRAQRLERALQSVLGTCCICLIHGDPEQRDGAKHELRHCQTLEDRLQSNFAAYKDWRQRLRYCKHHGMICYICHVPQIHDSLHPTFSRAQKGKGVECKYADIVGPIAYSIFHDMSLRRRAEAYFGVEWARDSVFADWLMDLPRDKSESNLIDLFLWYMEVEQKLPNNLNAEVKLDFTFSHMKPPSTLGNFPHKT